jgi:hypothetical protein
VGQEGRVWLKEGMIVAKKVIGGATEVMGW